MICYAAIKPCGCCVAATVIDDSDSPDRLIEAGRSVKRWKKDGMEVRSVTVEWVRENLHRCRCTPAARAKEE